MDAWADVCVRDVGSVFDQLLQLKKDKADTLKPCNSDLVREWMSYSWYGAAEYIASIGINAALLCFFSPFIHGSIDRSIDRSTGWL